MTKSIYVGAARETIRWVWSGHRKLSLFVSLAFLFDHPQDGRSWSGDVRWSSRHGRAVLKCAEIGQGSVKVIEVMVEIKYCMISLYL
jgi:hypothetical protein